MIGKTHQGLEVQEKEADSRVASTTTKTKESWVVVLRCLHHRTILIEEIWIIMEADNIQVLIEMQECQIQDHRVEEELMNKEEEEVVDLLKIVQ